jgi:hypothetical protein
MMLPWAHLTVLCLRLLHAEAFSWSASPEVQSLAASIKHEPKAACTAKPTTMTALPKSQQHDRRSWLQSAALLLPLGVLLDTQAAYAEATSVGDVKIAMRGKDVAVKDVLGKKATLIVSTSVSSIHFMLSKLTSPCNRHHSRPDCDLFFDALQVNVASYCALTPQYKDLVQLYEQHHADGLEVMLCIVYQLIMFAVVDQQCVALH